MFFFFEWDMNQKFDISSLTRLQSLHWSRNFIFPPDLKQNYFSFFSACQLTSSQLFAFGFRNAAKKKLSWRRNESPPPCRRLDHFQRRWRGGGGASGDGEPARRLINSWSLFAWDTYQLLVAAGHRADNKPLSWVSGSNSGGTFGKKRLFKLAIRLYGAVLSCITLKQDKNKEIHPASVQISAAASPSYREMENDWF